jgi:hypothetical protein
LATDPQHWMPLASPLPAWGVVSGESAEANLAPQSKKAPERRQRRTSAANATGTTPKPRRRSTAAAAAAGGSATATATATATAVNAVSTPVVSAPHLLPGDFSMMLNSPGSGWPLLDSPLKLAAAGRQAFSLAAQFLEQQNLPPLGLGSPLKQPHSPLSVQPPAKAEAPLATTTPLATVTAVGSGKAVIPGAAGQGTAPRPGHAGDRFERPLFGDATLDSFAMSANPIGENTMMALDLNMSETTLMGLTDGFMLKSLPAQDPFQQANRDDLPDATGDAAKSDGDVNDNGKRSAPPSFSGRFGKKAKPNNTP